MVIDEALRRAEALRDEDEDPPIVPTISWDEQGVPIKGVVMPWRLPRPPDAPPPRKRLATDPKTDPGHERRMYVEQLWRSMYSAGQIIEIVAHRYGVTGRTVANELAQIKKRYVFEEADLDTIRSRKAQMRSTLTDLTHESRATGDLATARYALDKLAKLDGLYAPTKVEIETKVNVIGLQINTIVAALDEDGLKALELVMGQLAAKGIAMAAEPEPSTLVAGDVIDVLASDGDDDGDDE